MNILLFCVLLLQVVRVCRVQTPMLWVRYCVKQQEMQEVLGTAGKCTDLPWCSDFRYVALRTAG
jgi:hypothetical protein